MSNSEITLEIITSKTVLFAKLFELNEKMFIRCLTINFNY